MEDEKIIELYFARDEAAITMTQQKYGGYLKSISFNILKNLSDAEECENDAYYAAWRKIPPEHPKNMAAFLGGIVRNISLDRYDYNHAKKRNPEFEVLLSELENVAAAIPSPEDDLEKRRLAQRISRFLGEIDSQKRQIFLRRYWYGDSIADISKRFGFSESKVTSLLFRVRNKLKKYLEKEGAAL